MIGNADHLKPACHRRSRLRACVQRLCFLAATLALVCVSGACRAAPNRLIATGWDSPNAAEFRRNAAEFEKWPFDGVTIFPTVQRADGRSASNGYAFGREKWAADGCRGMIADLQSTHSRLKAQSFLFCNANPGDVDWFDDAGWAQIVDHWRQLAHAARLGGLRGLLFDLEPYTPPAQQFNDESQPGTARHSFAQYALKARARGREVMQAVAREYPGATIFSYRLLSDLLPLTGQGGDPRQVLSGNTYALMPAFVDGWLDAAPPTITIIEGNEDIGYRANSPETFNRAYTRLRTEIPALLDPAHAGKYRSQVLIGHSLYLDAYANPPGSTWYIDPLGGTPTARLEANVAAALRAADSGYVWVYGERGRWWPPRAGASPYPLWTEKLAGCDAALRRAKDPSGVARAAIQSAQPSDNLLRNTDFASQGVNGLPSGWEIWQQDGSRGRPAAAQGVLLWAGAASATFLQEVAVQPGVPYALGARLRRVGHGSAMLSIGWKDAQHRWCAPEAALSLPPAAGSDAQGWQEVSGILTPPAGSAYMAVMFSVHNQPSPQDRALFRDVWCIKVK